MKKNNFWILSGLLLMLTASAFSQPGRGAPTLSRLVVAFSERENILASSLEKGDQAIVARSLADDFEARSADNPGRAIPRAEWITKFTKSKIGEISEMAVHDYGDIAVVSFKQLSADKKNAPNPMLIVDVWRKSSEDWLLSVRYTAP